MVMMVMEEAVLMAAADHVQDNRDHVLHPLVEDMEDLVAHHHLDPQADLEEEEDMGEYLLQVQDEDCRLAAADHHREVLLWADLHLNADHPQAILTDTRQTVLHRNVEDQMSRAWHDRWEI